MAPQALLIDVALAVKNGPAGMWHALSGPSRLAPFGPLARWLWPLALGSMAALAFVVRQVVRRRRPPRTPSA